MRNTNVLLMTVTTLLMLTQGCTMVQTYPLAARAGDTITIAPGSLDGATKTNLTVNYYSDSAPTTPINLTSSIRSVFNITPDRTSPAWLSSSAFSIPLSAGHGPWQTLIALDLPTTGLPVGTGKLRVSLGTGVTAPLIAHSPEGVDMALKILPDTGGMPNPFSYWAGWWEASVTTGSLNDLMPGKQYVVKTNLAVTGGNAVTYAAAEYHIYMPLRYKISGGIPDAEMLINNFAVILDNHPNFDRYQVGLRWHRDGDNIIVYITSPDRGGVDTQTRFSLVIDKTAPFDFLGTPSLTSVAYYDETGTVITTTRMPILQGINL